MDERVGPNYELDFVPRLKKAARHADHVKEIKDMLNELVKMQKIEHPRVKRPSFSELFPFGEAPFFSGGYNGKPHEISFYNTKATTLNNMVAMRTAKKFAKKAKIYEKACAEIQAIVEKYNKEIQDVDTENFE